MKQTQGLGHIVVRCVVCYYDLNKSQSENKEFCFSSGNMD